RSTDSKRDGEPETCGYDSTPGGIQPGPHCGAPPFTGLYTSVQSLDGFRGSTSAPASPAAVRAARAVGQGAARQVVGHRARCEWTPGPPRASKRQPPV